ncbi:CCNQ [Lepeophtheirus salmonis]|uniref:CCNQ n=1 Tax=Lepeophtheirus salmonis TaxID=72036 RepID=A0A7R8D587_LEPSM|nr:CCNQ [Lepeophtheirus salmonis]CAF3028319.1 CCNQ [Lepeophtheirus salmonis]
MSTQGTNPLSLERNPQLEYGKSVHPFVVCRFVFECCKKLELDVLSTATAITLFHSFYKSSRKKEVYDPYLIAGACIYLAGKVEDETEMRLRDVINVVHATLHPCKEPLSHDSEYFMHREALVEAELLLLRVLDFKVKFTHPHKYLLHYLKTLKDWIPIQTWSNFPIASTAWSLLQDFYHDPFLLECGPSKVALSCII